MGLTNYGENLALDAMLGSGHASGWPSTVYVALFLSVPADNGTGGTEVSGGDYARVSVTNNTTNWPAASGGVKSNGTLIVFPTPTADWGIIRGVGLYDASTAGNLLAVGTLSSAVSVTTSAADVNFEVGTLSFSLD